MDNNKIPEIKVVYLPQSEFNGVYYILTLSRKDDSIISKKGITITSRQDFTTLLEDINQYNNEHEDKYRKIVNQ